MITENARNKIDAWIKKFPIDQKQSALIAALKIVQEDNQGWLTDTLITEVAEYLNIPKIAAYEVATFYSMFDLKPTGRHKIYVCTNISCHLAGSEKVLDFLKKRLQIEVNETTPDGCFTLKEVECLAACGVAPVAKINQQYHEKLTLEKLESILSELEHNHVK